MPFNRTLTSTSNVVLSESDGFVNTIGTMDYSDTTFYSDIDSISNVIFVPITTDFDLNFSRTMTTNTVLVQTANTNVDVTQRNVKGSIAITHINNTQQDPSSSNNLKGFKLSSKPDTLSPNSITGDPSENNVEMSGQPQVSNSNASFTFTPITGLASNTTYFLNVAEDDLKDEDSVGLSFTMGNGFTTDNTRSIVTTGEYYEGFNIRVEEESLTADEVEDGFELVKLNTGETFSVGRAISGTIVSVGNKNYVYQLDSSKYKINVAYTTGATTSVKSDSHGLENDDIIQVYDIVSGSGVGAERFTVEKIDNNNFKLKRVNSLGGVDGRLNYYPILKKDDIVIKKDNDNSKKVHFKILNNATLKLSTLDYTSKNSKIVDVNPNNGATSLNAKGARFVRLYENNILSYIPVDDSSSESGTIKISDTDYFSNNNILDITKISAKQIDGEFQYSNTIIRCHTIANSFPTHNTNPFNTAAPEVFTTFPRENDSFTSKLQITSLTRRNDTEMTVITNHPHNLNVGDKIRILDSDVIEFNSDFADYDDNFFTITELLSDSSFKYILPKSPSTQKLESTGPVKLKYTRDDGENYEEKLNCIQVEFSQSMNTSSISISNSSFFIFADGTEKAILSTESPTDATVQISIDNFETILSCQEIKANTGNSLYTIQTTTVPKGKRFKVKVSNTVMDLGSTKPTYNFLSVDGFTTGTVSVDEETGEEQIFTKDEDPPEIRKVSFSVGDVNLFLLSNVSSDGSDADSSLLTEDNSKLELENPVSGLVLESSNTSEISFPSKYQKVPIDLSGENLIIQFNEGMNPDTISVNTQNTDPLGSIQLSCDDYATVVQMENPIFTDRLEENDTVTLVPVANLSSNSTYTLRIFDTLSDDSPEQNKLQKTNVTSIMQLTLNQDPPSVKAYQRDEIVRGLKSFTIKSSRGTPLTGFNSGQKFRGRTSGALGQIFDFENGGQLKLENGSDLKLEDDSVQDYFIILQESENIKSMRYNELATSEGVFKNFVKGEICDFLNLDGSLDENKRFSIGSTTILPAPLGKTVSYVVENKTFVYRQENLLYKFGNADRLVGKNNLGYANTFDPVAAIGPGFKTDDTLLTATVKFRRDDNTLVSLDDGSQTGIDIDSNLIVQFNQTVNTATLTFGSDNSDRVLSSHSIVLSYDSNFQNCITLDSEFRNANNDTFFEFKPSILNQVNPELQLTQGDAMHVRLSNSIKSKGGKVIDIGGTTLEYANTATISTAHNFTCENAFVFSQGRKEIFQTVGTKLLNVDSNQLIASVIFKESLNSGQSFSAVSTVGGSGEIQLATADPVTDISELYTGTVDFSVSGEFNNELLILFRSSLLSLTDYYLTINNSITNETGETLLAPVTFYFQTS